MTEHMLPEQTVEPLIFNQLWREFVEKRKMRKQTQKTAKAKAAST